jgi:hypothetical protein
VTTCVALLRGINVGRAKRLGMAELREVVESLGHTNVRTLLNSGNVVFDAKRGSLPTIALARGRHSNRVRICRARHRCDGCRGRRHRQANFARAPDDPSRYLVAFLPSAAALVKARPLLAEAWAPEALAVHASCVPVVSRRHHRVEALAGVRTRDRRRRHDAELGNGQEAACGGHRQAGGVTS